MSMESPDGFERGVHIQLEKDVWMEAGCKEFFQKLNFEMMQKELNSPWVTMSAPVVKLDRKMLHCATTAVNAVFGEQCPLPLYWHVCLSICLSVCPSVRLSPSPITPHPT